MFRDINDLFYIDKLCLINNDLFFNQLVNDLQSPSIQKNSMKGFIIKNIMTKTIIKIKRKQKKKYKMKWKGYARII